ncbi:hypothetical protein N7532_007616 [Penicillium argentinense]|uniref:Uncharacterized protein n=1 Tax=Penicillium argentinense TaxID=1131581 RepID=A0A9W9EVR4_9EURO|nr:uncharacterized protein N7532_007616 [Penicillium argentinense]KAJ5088932.1 hypothetical protein N7532_007616 [Penicillium argentinense]
MGTDYASFVCEQEKAVQCVKYVGYVQHGLDGLFLVMGFMHGSIGLNKNDYQQSFGDGAVKRDLSSSPDWNLLDQVLRSEGWKFDSMEQINVSNVTVTKRDSDPSLVHRTIARNVAVDDQGNSSDISFNFFDNGDFNLHVAGDSNSLPSGTKKSSNINRRFSGAGFKIAATTRVRSKLTRAHQTKMSYFIAQDWASDTYKMSMSDYVGLVKTDHTANFYFRIIPEIKGFGLNYESVNVCGQLGQFL